MKLIGTILREILGLFVDDGSLALAILALVGLVAVLTAGFAVPGWIAGLLLFAGALAILAENLLRGRTGR